MVNAETIIKDPPEHVTKIFENIMEKLKETDTLIEKKALRNELIEEEEHKILGLIFEAGDPTIYIAISGLKKAFNTYEIENYTFVYMDQSGVYRRQLDYKESNLARQALQLILLEHNFDVNVKPYRP